MSITYTPGSEALTKYTYDKESATLDVAWRFTRNCYRYYRVPLPVYRHLYGLGPGPGVGAWFNHNIRSDYAYLLISCELFGLGFSEGDTTPPAAVPGAPLAITALGNNQYIVRWHTPKQLESAPTIQGPWTPVAAIKTKDGFIYQFTASAPQGFFRLQP